MAQEMQKPFEEMSDEELTAAYNKRLESLSDEELRAEYEAQSKQKGMPAIDEEAILAAPIPEEVFSEAEAAPKEPIGVLEAGLRTARQVASGAYIGASEPAAFLPAEAITRTIMDAMERGDIDTAEKTISAFKANWEKSRLRQEEYKEQYPYVSTAAEIGGGFIPGSPSMMLGATALKAPTLLKAGAELAKTGAKAGLMYEASQVASEAVGDELTAGEMAKRYTTGAATGFVAAPVTAAGITAAGMGAQLLSKAAVNPVTMFLNQVIFGPKIATQKEFVKLEKQIQDLPDLQTVTEFLEEVRASVSGQKKLNEQDLRSAIEGIDSIQNRLSVFEKEASDERKTRIRQVLSELNGIKEEAQSQVITLRKGVSSVQDELSRQESPELVPYANETKQAAEDLKKMAGELSSQARDKLPADYRMKTSSLKQMLKEAASNLKIQGKPGAFGEKYKQGIQRIEKYITDLDEMGDELNAQQVKDILRQLDEDIFGAKPVFEFNKPAQRELKGVRRKINETLIYNDQGKESEYGKAMRPVRDVLSLIEKMDDLAGSSDSSIISFLRKAVNEPEYGKLIAEIDLKTGSNIKQGILEIKKSAELRDRGNKRALLESSPEYIALTQAQDQLRAATTIKSEKRIRELVKDPELAETIIELKRALNDLGDPKAIERRKQEYVNSQLQEYATQMGIPPGSDVSSRLQSTAAQAKALAEKRRDEIMERVAAFGEKQSGASVLTSILRGSEGFGPTDNALRVIKAISNLPEQEFADIFSIIGLKDPTKFEEFANALRVRHAMSYPRTQGSRRVVMGNAAKEAVDVVIGPGSKAYSWMLPFIMGAADEFGGKASQAYLRYMTRIGGLPTYKKLVAGSPDPYSRNFVFQVQRQVGEMLQGVEPNQLFPISEANAGFVEQDIRRSGMSASEKAAAINNVRKYGMIDGKSVSAVMSEGLEPEAMRPSTVLSAPKKQPEKNLLEKLAK